jgi:uncharacterized protein (UPF0262 family)
MTHKDIETLTLEEDGAQRLPEVEHERAIALADLLTENRFFPCDAKGDALFAGPYHVHAKIAENRLMLAISAESYPEPHIVWVPIAPLKSVVKDYFLICDSYYKAVASRESHKIEAVDMGRRSVHNEGAEKLQELMHTKIRMDFDTARRLFTLISVLHVRIGF